jgi:antitoxin component YwqK of YwqJK toxin-antitoxin module
MLKYILFISAIFFLSNLAVCQNKDTIKAYFKSRGPIPQPVTNIDSADFIRLIVRSSSDNSLADVKEYYKDGKIKLVGKTEYKFFSSFYVADIKLEGDHISFYPSGKKEKVMVYDKKSDSYSEYRYYPSGKLYTYVIYKQGNYSEIYLSDFLECYRNTGEAICQNGSGEWITYDNEYKNIILSGAIKAGKQNGEWNGSVTRHHDSITYRYKYIFKNGRQISATGYDKNGNAYPFTDEIVMAKYREGAFVFLDLFKGHLKIPKDANGKRVSIDSVYISFVVEKDGHLANLELIGSNDKSLNEALTLALAKSPEWSPTKCWGIPVRTKVILPLITFKAVDNSSRNENILFKMTLLE